MWATGSEGHAVRSDRYYGDSKILKPGNPSASKKYLTSFKVACGRESLGEEATSESIPEGTSTMGSNAPEYLQQVSVV